MVNPDVGPASGLYTIIYNQLYIFNTSKINSRSKSFMHVRKIWMKTMASRCCCCRGRWCVIFCCSVFSARGSYVLKFLVSLWSQVFFSAAPQFPEVSAGNCSALYPAQSLKIFFLPTTETITCVAQKSFTWFLVTSPRTPGHFQFTKCKEGESHFGH